ncbi:YheC/YheD family protein [Longirhabdus pacifica]|uniref:YheC/YheD family protein n=1 Tax=Longirhabdus pacifica TaxID=2305227 RepID=UPI00100917B0|nr:YheC/YheD family protein [Longirhabdus pacifica]
MTITVGGASLVRAVNRKNTKKNKNVSGAINVKRGKKVNAGKQYVLGDKANKSKKINAKQINAKKINAKKIKAKRKVKIIKKINPRNKWMHYRLFQSNQRLSAHLPHTVLMTSKTLHSMLMKYRMVYIKPTVGAFGKGVMKVEYIKDINGLPFRYQVEEAVYYFTSFSDLMTSIRKHTIKKPYIIQRGVELINYQSRPVDLRIMLQKEDGQYNVVGIACRVAHPDKIITNASGGGEVIPVQRLLTSSRISKGLITIYKMQEVALLASKVLKNKFPQIKEFGVDIGLDKTMKPWIIEINTRPLIRIFEKLGDRDILDRIQRNRNQ